MDKRGRVMNTGMIDKLDGLYYHFQAQLRSSQLSLMREVLKGTVYMDMLMIIQLRLS